MRYTKLVMQGVWLVVCCCFLSAVPTQAVDKIDTEFGNNGFVLKDFGLGDDEALALAVQPDGKLLVAGYSSNGAVKNVTVARYLSSGILDISFNYDGVFTLSMGSGDSIARSIAVQNDGRILIAGSTFDMEPRLAVVALTEDGYLDSTFGENGQVILPVQDEAIVTTDLKLAADGAIFIAATIENSDSSRYPLFAKMSSGGEIASGFGEDGIVLQEADYSIEVQGIALLDDGKILAAGSIEQDGVVQAGLLMRNADGTSDMTFGHEGELLLGIEGVSSVVNGLFVESGGSVLLAGSVENENFHQAFAVRLEENGTLDPYFAGNGLFKSDLGYDNVAYGISVLQDKSIVLAGFGSPGQGKDLIVWSIQGDVSSGSSEEVVILDAQQQIVLRSLSVQDTDVEQVDAEDDVQMEQLSEFIAPPVITDIANEDDIGYAVVALESGQVLTVGSSGNGTDKDFVLVRYTSENIAAALASETAAKSVSTAGFKVLTTPIEDITRVGAVTGGNIFDTNTLSCETACSDDIDNDGCIGGGLTQCLEKRTITYRGVVFAVYKNPVYRAGDTASTDTDVPAEGEDRFIYDTVRWGQTEDGSGTGLYGSDIQNITPNVTYYVRAYGVLADGTVIYGNQLTFKTHDACFIATATYGTLLDGHVTLLRQFRDTYLVPYSFGRKVVGVYYHFSPAMADIVSGNVLLRGIVRIALWPFVGLALFMLKASPTIKIMGIVLAAFFAGFCLRPQACVRKN